MAELAETIRGTVLRFDQIKGYGFIAPNEGGDDVFMHANDLLDDKALFDSGAIVEFVREHEERGPKASSVQLVDPGPRRPAASVVAHVAESPLRTPDTREEGSGRIVPKSELLTQVTEILLTTNPPLTGPQIIAARRELLAYCVSQDWVS